jgi:Cu(I)/Ag(I) efflux system membrane fusion protein
VVSDVLPLFDPSTRTMKVRLEAANPRYALRPDMFVDVELPIELSPTLAVPTDAVLDTGLKKTVFIDRGEGFFEPREVETGWRLGNRVEITKGLEPGERIVVSGTFLIDSESRMELAAAGMVENLATDPVCGLPVSIRKAEESGKKRLPGKTTTSGPASAKTGLTRSRANTPGKPPGHRDHQNDQPYHRFLGQ